MQDGEAVESSAGCNTKSSALDIDGLRQLYDLEYPRIKRTLALNQIGYASLEVGALLCCSLPAS
jgi:hypothetical protein